MANSRIQAGLWSQNLFPIRGIVPGQGYIPAQRLKPSVCYLSCRVWGFPEPTNISPVRQPVESTHIYIGLGFFFLRTWWGFWAHSPALRQVPWLMAWCVTCKQSAVLWARGGLEPATHPRDKLGVGLESSPRKETEDFNVLVIFFLWIISLLLVSSFVCLSHLIHLFWFVLSVWHWTVLAFTLEKAEEDGSRNETGEEMGFFFFCCQFTFKSCCLFFLFLDKRSLEEKSRKFQPFPNF